LDPSVEQVAIINFFFENQCLGFLTGLTLVLLPAFVKGYSTFCIDGRNWHMCQATVLKLNGVNAS